MGEDRGTRDTASGPWTRFDPAAGPGLDPARWQPLLMPPGRGDHPAVDPGAVMQVGEGRIHIDLPRFTVADDSSQPGDSAKHVFMSRTALELDPAGPSTFAVDLDVHNVDGAPEDYRLAFAAFHVVDLDATRRSFSVCGTSTRVLALHEQVGLPADGSGGAPFFHMVESPYADFDDDFTRPRTCEIVLDRSQSSARWRVDGQTIYSLPTTLVPQRVHLGFGMWTQLPLRDGHSRSRAGQGMTATWGDLRHRGARAPS